MKLYQQGNVLSGKNVERKSLEHRISADETVSKGAIPIIATWSHELVAMIGMVP